MRRRHPAWWKRYLAGLAGGAAGTLAMDLYQKGSAKLLPSAPSPGEHDVSLGGRQHRRGESATAAIGRIAYRKIKGQDPDEKTTAKLSNLVHWSYGVDMGGAYGLLRTGRVPLLACGAAYGAALWLVGDEIAVPLLGLAEGPRAYPARVHAETFGAHLVYGIATAAATRIMERLL